MQISTKFSLAIHILCMISYLSNARKKVTGDIAAASCKSNPVIVRNTMALLRRAGLITIVPGAGGATLTRAPSEITMDDVFAAVHPVKEGRLFKIHPNPGKDCPVGKYIPDLLTPLFTSAQKSMEDTLASTTLQDMMDKLYDWNHIETPANRYGVTASAAPA